MFGKKGKTWFYIDVYAQGLEIALRQMIDIINGNNTFRPQFQTVENVKGYVTKNLILVMK